MLGLEWATGLGNWVFCFRVGCFGLGFPARGMEAADAAIVALASLALVPFVSRARHAAAALFLFLVKWASAAAAVAVLVAATENTSAYGALRAVAAAAIQRARAALDE